MAENQKKSKKKTKKPLPRSKELKNTEEATKINAGGGPRGPMGGTGGCAAATNKMCSKPCMSDTCPNYGC